MSGPRNYLLADIKNLFALSGNQCAAPGCTISMIAEDGNTTIGEICHISAASPNGPRYDKNLTDDKRRRLANLILLCPIHHNMIDNPKNIEEYTTEVIAQWKLDHFSSNENRIFSISDNLAENALNKFEKSIATIIDITEEILVWIKTIKNGNAEENNFQHKLMLKKHLDELSGNSITGYIEKVPFMFRDIIKVLYSNDNNNNKNLSEYRKIGEQRYELIKMLFYNFTDLFRFSILAILWEEICEEKIKTSSPEVFSLMKTPIEDINSAHIFTLKLLIKEIFEEWGEKKLEVPLVAAFSKTIKEVEVGIQFFSNPLDEGPNKLNKCCEAELFLHKLLSVSTFLNEYKFRSVYSRNYIKYRNNKEPNFMLEYRFYNKGKQEQEEIEKVDPRFKETNSVYLCLKRNNHIVINLSPFYFDMNSYGGNTIENIIHLYVLKQILDDYDQLDLRFKVIPSPIRKEKTYSRNDFNEVSIEKDINSISSYGLSGDENAPINFKSKAIYKQFNFLLKKLII